jgi:iron complex transport system substrate-binding protein
LLARLEASGVQVLTITDVNTFKGIENNIDAVSQGLGVPERGEALAARMAATLRQAAPAPAAPRPSALYLTAGGFTAGRGTLVDAILSAAGFANAAAGPWFAPVSVERIALYPPAMFVLGFFDQVRADWRGPGRHPVVQGAARGRVVARLPAAALTCPAWFAADAAALLKTGR